MVTGKQFFPKSLNLVFLWVSFLAISTFISGCSPNPKKYNPPERTLWAPDGARTVPAENDALDNPAGYFRALHSDTLNSDEVAIAAAPVFEEGWIAETDKFVPEGPTFDKNGNLYFSPLLPEEDVVLISLDSVDGSRRWAIEGFSNGGGAPLILDDPDNSGEQIIYVGLYDKAIAVKPDGTVLWDQPTGLAGTLEVDPLKHVFGINYDPITDTLIGLAADGNMYALDRKTGNFVLSSGYIIPGENSPPGTISIPENIKSKMDTALGTLINQKIISTGKSPTDILLNALLGNESKVANYFSVDPHSGKIWVAATSPDAEDGVEDGVSTFGAVYCLQLDGPDENGKFTIEEIFHTSFLGGTASTPALSADGTRVYVGDNFGKLITIDADNGRIIWELDVGVQIFASISVASDNDELYLSTSDSVIKVVDKGTSGEEIWRSDFDMYHGYTQKNLLTATICSNGIAIQAAPCIVLGDMPPMPLALGVGLLDRETGKVRYFSKAREESVSVSQIGPDGSMYIGYSPIRRAASAALLGNLVKPITGGIQKFSAKRLDLLIRDAVHAAADRAKNVSEHIGSLSEPERKIEIKQIGMLIAQCRKVSSVAVDAGDLSGQEWSQIDGYLLNAESALSLTQADFEIAYNNLNQADILLPNQ